ncbi:hypothetical protein [Slackia sp.]|uniref:hypothetical protein n=2 Tax=Slackia TaxID=84108 RepID=UPI002636E15D|nr:hypothetical protein [Slackia sp.]
MTALAASPAALPAASSPFLGLPRPRHGAAAFAAFSSALALRLKLPHSNARYASAGMSQRSECMCAGLAGLFSWIGRAPRELVLDNAAEAGRRVRGEVAESSLFSVFRAHYRCSSRCCNPYSGNEKGSVENAVGFVRRNLLVPVLRVGSLAELNALLQEGYDRLSASSRARDGRPTPEALAEDLAVMLALPPAHYTEKRLDKEQDVGCISQENL